MLAPAEACFRNSRDDQSSAKIDAAIRLGPTAAERLRGSFPFAANATGCRAAAMSPI
jgi:hypothetical protein